MANAKKSTEEKEIIKVENEIAEENVKTTKTESSTDNVDINKMIQDAIAKSVADTAKIYQEKIDALELKLKESATSESADIKTIDIKLEDESITIKPDKMIWIQHMAPGSASFHKGRINITFDKLFDKRRIKWDILDEMFYEFHAWYSEFEIVILDEEVRKYYGIESDFEENGADENSFVNLLSEKNNVMIDKISKFSFIVSSSFLKYFCEQYIAGNVECLKNNKFLDIQKYYKERYNIDNLQELVQEMSL